MCGAGEGVGILQENMMDEIKKTQHRRKPAVVPSHVVCLEDLADLGWSEVCDPRAQAFLCMKDTGLTSGYKIAPGFTMVSLYKLSIRNGLYWQLEKAVRPLIPARLLRAGQRGTALNST